MDELRDFTGGCTATIYLYADASVAYFTPYAQWWQEVGNLKGGALAVALRILEDGGVPGGLA